MHHSLDKIVAVVAGVAGLAILMGSAAIPAEQRAVPLTKAGALIRSRELPWFDSAVAQKSPWNEGDGGATDPADNKQCGSAVCASDQDCCNESCSLCVAHGKTCTDKICGMACGPNTCNFDQVCCNPSCGECTLPGGTCSHRVCPGPTHPSSESCGMNTCNVGQVCCNASCGICAEPGATCSQKPCW